MAGYDETHPIADRWGRIQNFDFCAEEEPSTTWPYMLWIQPGTTTLRVRNANDTAWVAIGTGDHGLLGGLADDDHAQYHNDARGDARYYTETELDAGQLDNRYYTEAELDAGQLDNRYFTEAEHLDVSAGAGDAGKPIKLDAGGHVDATMINSADVDHGTLGGLADDDHTQYLLAAGTRALSGAWDVGAFAVTFGAGVAFDGASGVNAITIPDGLAKAIHIIDDGGVPVEFLTIDTLNNEIVFNLLELDVDVRFAGLAATNLFFFRGSDGFIAFGGPGAAIGSNWELQMTNNHASAMRFIDVGDASDYLTFVTLDGAREVVVNQDAHANIDFRAEAVGHPDALVVQGSDGQATLGALGLGIAHASAAGVLSSSTVEADELSMDIGDMLFNAADGLLLLNPDGKVSDTEWWSLRKQLATLSGAFHQEAGRWLGTRGLVVEEATTNLITNPSFEVDLTGWAEADADASMTPTQDSALSRFGDYSLKLVNADAGDNDFMQFTIAAPDALTDYTITAWVNVTVFTAGAVNDRGLGGFDDADVGTLEVSTITAATNGWERHRITVTTSAAPGNLKIRLYGPQGTVYWDGVQCEKTSYATTYADGTLGTGYAWTGAAHGSTSTRTVTEVNLDAHVGLISANGTVSFRIVAQMPYDSDATWPNANAKVWGATGRALKYVFADDTFQLYVLDAWIVTTAAQTFKAGDWLDIICTFDYTADEYNIYINGELAGTDDTAKGSDAVVSWNVGSSIIASQHPGITVAEYAVFNRVLTAIEVAGMYALQRPLIDAGSLDKPPACFTDGIQVQQDALSEELIEFITTVGAGNPIDTAGLGAYYGKVRVMVDGVGYKVLALYEES